MTMVVGSVPGRGGRHRTQQKESEVLLVYMSTRQFVYYLYTTVAPYVSISTNVFVCICMSNSLLIFFSLSLSLSTPVCSPRAPPASLPNPLGRSPGLGLGFGGLTRKVRPSSQDGETDENMSHNGFGKSDRMGKNVAARAFKKKKLYGFNG